MTALPTLKTSREHARHCPFVPCVACDEYIVCESCGGSGILFNNTGPSGLHRKCGECDGAGRWPVEADNG